MRTKRVARLWHNAPDTMTISGKTYRRAQLMRRQAYPKFGDEGAGIRLARAYVADYHKQGKSAYIVHCADGIGVYVR